MTAEPVRPPRRVRRRLAKGLLIAAAFLLALIGLMAAVGATLPVRHHTSLQSVYPAPRDTLFALITDVERFAEWRTGVERVEPRPNVQGRPRWQEVGPDGAILYETVESTPARRHVTRIADPELPFGGSWTFELEDAPPGTLLRITEDGEIYNPIFRFVSRYILGHDRTIERYLADLRSEIGP